MNPKITNEQLDFLKQHMSWSWEGVGDNAHVETTSKIYKLGSVKIYKNGYVTIGDDTCWNCDIQYAKKIHNEIWADIHTQIADEKEKLLANYIASY
jgi:hypothetical protein